MPQGRAHAGFGQEQGITGKRRQETGERRRTGSRLAVRKKAIDTVYQNARFIAYLLQK